MKINNAILSFSIFLSMCLSFTNEVVSQVISSESLSQDTMNNDDQMAYFADAMRNTIKPKHRIRANDDFYDLIKSDLSNSLSFEKSYSFLADFISILDPKDKSFRIFSWQLDLDKTFKYFGFIQMKDGRVIELKDHSTELLTSSYEILDPENWFGALYYNMRSFRQGRTDYYLLFGYNAKNQYANQKVVEVLSFDGEMLIFGAPVFVMNAARRPDERYRYILEYEESTTVRLNYDEDLEKIVFDHLIPFGAYIDENTETMVPDGSYSSFEFNNGKWIFNEKLFHHKSDTPPGSGKSSSNSKKDVFGRNR